MLKGDRAQRHHLEESARASIEERMKRRLTDAEWSQVRAKFLDLAKILRSWEKPAPPP
jgi:hypothetical protein